MKKVIGFCLLVALWYIKPVWAQQCGPFCPVCSGSGSSTGGLVSPGVLIQNFLYIPNGKEEIGVINLRGGATSWLDLGIGYTIEAKKTVWSLRLQPLTETESSWQPTIIVGTGSVQTGRSDQSIFVQLSKSWEFSEVFAMRISSGIASLLPDTERLYGLAALTLTITDHWSPFITHDGINFHPGISWIPTDWLSVATILIESSEPAISVSFRYSLQKDR